MVTLVLPTKTEWIKALKSGNYRKGTKYLSNGGRFCCLGVLQDLVSRKSVVKRAYLSGSSQYLATDDIGLYSVSWARKLGLTIKVQEVLVDLNDGNEERDIKPRSFKQIAEYIKKNIPAWGKGVIAKL